MLVLFATPSNTKLPVLCTRFFHPQVWSTDALAITWDNLYAYAFPPWCLIQHVLLKLRESNTVLLLVAPYWPNQPWFPLLLEMLIDYPFRFPLRTNLLTQAGGKIWHQRLRHLSLAARKLSLNVSLVKDFHRKLRSWPQVPADPLPCQLTTLDWSGRLVHRERSRSLDAPVEANADFFVTLFNEGKQVSTIRNYRSAISSIHKGFPGPRFFDWH